jgi:hypothetical protein
MVYKAKDVTVQFPHAVVTVKIFQGDTDTPVFTRKTVVHGCSDPQGKEPPPWEIVPAKGNIVFDEKMRVGLQQPTVNQSINDIGTVTWKISDDRFMKITTPIGPDGRGLDDGRTVMVQALHHATSEHDLAVIDAEITFADLETLGLSTSITIISDQVEYTANVIEAPYVGFSLSTPQLYLLANIGYQMFKNSLLTPRILDSVQVAAVLQNTFSAGMYMSGAGDFPITMNDADSANLTFTLCDANYHPIKLLSPMYVILKVDPAPNPVEDIAQWNQVLPRVRRPQVQPIYHQLPRINIFEHPDLLTAWIYPPDIM